MRFDLALHTGHNSSYTIAKDGVILEVLELERLIGKKNAGHFYYLSITNRKSIAVWIREYFKSKYNVDKYDTIVRLAGNEYHENLLLGDVLEFFNADKYVFFKHQDTHAANSLYQSPHNEALIVSCDGGGDDGFFVTYHAVKGQPLVKLNNIHNRNLGMKYAQIGTVIPQIKKSKVKHENYYSWAESRNMDNLVNSGKLMGLAAYGKVREEWIEEFKTYYYDFDSLMKGWIEMDTKLTEMLNRLNITGIPFQHLDLNYIIVDEETGKDLAATNQYVFEKVFEELIENDLNQFPNLPLHITGGCGLNILNNTLWLDKRETFITPNPNDCGLSLGLMLSYLTPTTPVDSTYLGPEVFDKHMLAEYIEQYNSSEVNLSELANDINNGSIVGIVNGRCEHGARALGNRSILCNPMIPGMKDTLNKKVKGREYYRPFAPVIRFEDIDKYYYWEKGESRWMSFAATIKPEYADILKEIVHEDGTSRIQTVKREQNPWLYDLLTEFELKSGIGILLNTSFNVAGKPILNTYRDALEVFNTTELDKLVLDNFYIKK
jgi:carbamoyltransferase